MYHASRVKGMWRSRLWDAMPVGVSKSREMSVLRRTSAVPSICMDTLLVILAWAEGDTRGSKEGQGMSGKEEERIYVFFLFFFFVLFVENIFIGVIWVSKEDTDFTTADLVESLSSISKVMPGLNFVAEGDRFRMGEKT